MQKTDRKTVLQGLIEELQLKKSECDNSSLSIVLTGFINMLNEKLPAERQQMEDAFNKGSALNNYSTSMDLDWKYKDFTDYFTQTFNNGE